MRTIFICITVLALLSISQAKDEVQIADLLKQHLNSVGTEQARTVVKTRVAEGTVHFQVLNQGTGQQDGKEALVSTGNKIVSMFRLPNPSYHGERFISDGNKTGVAMVIPGTYSEFGQFIRVHDEILRDGLWGGVLSTGWALENLESTHAKLQYKGTRKVDGRDLHRVLYLPSRHSDLEIELYFDPETFRHVMTSYAYTINPQIAHSDIENARQQTSHYRLEERFSDFKAVDNLTLPGRWTIQFTPDVPAGSEVGHPLAGVALNATSQFAVTVINITHNQPLDPRNFEIK